MTLCVFHSEIKFHGCTSTLCTYAFYASVHCVNAIRSITYTPYRMKPTAVLMLYLAVMVLCHQISQQIAAATQAPYTLVDSRARGSNVITLRCRNSNDVFDSQAMYFLNGTRLDSHDGFQDTDRDPGRVVFQISRRLEGEYSCGTELQRSPSLSFIGKLSILILFVTNIL